MKASTGFRTQALSLTAGIGGRFGGMNDQKGSHFAPWAIQSRMSEISRAVSFSRPRYAGGMRTVLLSELTRR